MISKKQRHELWLAAGLTDNYVFCNVFSDPELCKGLIERLLDLNIDNLTVEPVMEKTIKFGKKHKGIRLDIYAESQGRMYDIEIQTTNRHDLELRTRYYHSMMDRPALKPNQDYRNLKESYVLFICTFDPFGFGQSCYKVNKILNDKNEWVYNDKTHTVFYNINEFAKENDEHKRNFLELLKNGNAKDDYSSKVLEMFDYTKQNSYKERCFMIEDVYKYDYIYDGKQIGIAIGREEGLAQGAYNKAIETAKKMLQDNIDIEIVSKYTGLSIEEISALK